jgi:hypothetical protein
VLSGWFVELKEASEIGFGSGVIEGGERESGDRE